MQDSYLDERSRQSRGVVWGPYPEKKSQRMEHKVLTQLSGNCFRRLWIL